VGKNGEPNLCPNCALAPIFLHEVKKESWTNQPTENSNLKLCSRMRALAREHGILYLCKNFNYGFGVEPQQPQPTPKVKNAKQTTLY